jgi:hypothetical protein
MHVAIENIRPPGTRMVGCARQSGTLCGVPACISKCGCGVP